MYTGVDIEPEVILKRRSEKNNKYINIARSSRALTCCPLAYITMRPKSSPILPRPPKKPQQIAASDPRRSSSMLKLAHRQGLLYLKLKNAFGHEPPSKPLKSDSVRSVSTSPFPRVPCSPLAVIDHISNQPPRRIERCVVGRIESWYFPTRWGHGGSVWQTTLWCQTRRRTHSAHYLANFSATAAASPSWTSCYEGEWKQSASPEDKFRPARFPCFVLPSPLSSFAFLFVVPPFLPSCSCSEGKNNLLCADVVWDNQYILDAGNRTST